MYRAELHKRALQWERSTAYVFAGESMWRVKRGSSMRRVAYAGGSSAIEFASMNCDRALDR